MSTIQAVTPDNAAVLGDALHLNPDQLDELRLLLRPGRDGHPELRLLMLLDAEDGEAARVKRIFHTLSGEAQRLLATALDLDGDQRRRFSRLTTSTEEVGTPEGDVPGVRSIDTVAQDAVTALAAALGLNGRQRAKMLDLVTSTEEIDSVEVARIFGLKEQTIRLWRRDRRRALQAGLTPGPGDFIAPVGYAGQSPVYPRGAVLLWGMQTERLLWNGEVNHNRLLPGRHTGAAPRQRVSEDFTEQRGAVLLSYRARRRGGASDDQARADVARELGLTRQVVARRLLEVTREPLTYGPLWVESETAKAS